MILKLYRKYSIESFFFAIFLAIILWIPFFINKDLPFVDSSLIFLLPFNSLILNKIVFWLYFLALSLFYHFSLKKNSFVEEETFFRFYFFIIFLSNSLFLDQIFITLVFLIFVFAIISNNFNSNVSTLQNAFMLGVILGILVFINLTFLAFVPFFVLSIIFFKGSISKDLLTFIGGFIVMILLLLEVYFLKYNELDFSHFFAPKIDLISAELTLFDKIALFLFVFVGFIAFWTVVGKLGTFEILKRINFRIFFVYILTVIAIVIFTREIRFIYLLSVPLGFFLEYYFVNRRLTLLDKILFYILLIVSFAASLNLF